MGVRAIETMPPASILGVIRITVTPLSVSPFWMARATGAAPRYAGRIDPCRLMPPSRGIDSKAEERIWP